MPDTDEMNTMRPQRARTIARTDCLATRKAPARLASITAAKSSSDMRSTSLSRVMPALHTTISGAPSRSVVSASALATDSGSVTSQRTHVRLWASASGGGSVR